MFLSKYAVARHIYIPIIKRGVVDFAVGADWTPVAGDVKINIDNAGAGNVTNLPAAGTMGNTAVWDFSLTSGELTGKQIVVTVADSATKAVEDQSFIIETYGNASAQHVMDFGTAIATPLTAAQIATSVWQDTTAGDFTTALSVGKSVMNGVALGTGLTVNGVTGLTVSNLDAAISSRMATYAQPAGFLAATFPAGTVANTTNITAGTVTTTTNLTTNNDKTGYTLTSAYDPAKTAAQAGNAMALTSGERTSVADALLDRTDAIETGVTMRGLMRLLGSVLVGKLSGAGTTTEVFRNAIADSKARVTATVDGSGNRTAISTDLT